MQLLIIGAGAIGRSFLPWVFPPHKWEYFYEDTNPILMDMIRRHGKFTSWRTAEDDYLPIEVPVSPGYPKTPHLIITAVGPRPFLTLADRFMGTSTTIISCENDSRLPLRMRSITGNPHIYFAIPDVISSNTAPSRILATDSLAVVTETGTMYLDKELEPSLHKHVKATFLDKQDMKHQWMAKLYLHNTPHCILAYLGYKQNCRYIHDAMAYRTIRSVIEDVMIEMQQMVCAMYDLSPEFASWYASKEMSRFENKLLCDPVARVAREPLRKLALSERLIGAAMLCLQCGITPVATLKGIRAAVEYANPKDQDFHIMSLFRRLPLDTFIQGILHVRPEEKVYVPIKEVLSGHQ